MKSDATEYPRGVVPYIGTWIETALVLQVVFMILSYLI